MYLLEIDESSQALLSLIGRFLDLIHIAVPIMLILLVSIDLGKAVISQDEDQIVKAVRSIKNRVIAALAVFFVPTFVELLFSRVFISLNIDQQEYEKILSTYKSVIYSENIDIQDETQNTEILSASKYSIASKDNKQQLENEQSLIEISKTLTPIIFSLEKPNTIINLITTENFSINYNNKSYKINDKIKITYEDINAEEVFDNGDYVICNIMLNDAFIDNDNYENIILNYYYIQNENKFKLDKIGIEAKEKITNYNKQLKDSEKPKEIVSSAKYVSKNNIYDYTKLNSFSEKQINSLYNKNKNNVVIIKSFYKSAVTNKSMGFFIRNGVIASSWSFIQKSLMNGQTILVSDINSNSYKVAGVVAIDTAKDIVVLKLDKEVKRSITFSFKSKLSKNDPVLTITSKTGVGLSSITGIISSTNDDILSVLPLSKSDSGSPLFDFSGNVIGINTSKLIESELSTASSIDGLITLQKDLKTTKFKDIKITPLNEIKSKYFYKQKNKETIRSNISSEILKEYNTFGNIESNIVLDLVKSSYYNGILSLRYLNETHDYISNLDYASDFIMELKENKFKLVSSSSDKIVYKKGKDRVLIMSEFDYLIIVLVKGKIL